MTYSLTIFKSLYDNKTDKRMDFASWDKFEQTLYGLASQPLPDKKSAQLISPAVYQPGTTRANKNVVEWAGWAAVDVDSHVFEGNLENELRDRYGHWYYVCYSTASSKEDHPKFRLIFPLKSAVEQSKIKEFWFALNSEVGSIGDKQTKDLSRMYYIPANYADANNFIFTNTGEWIDPFELIKKHPLPVAETTGKNFFDRLPVAMQQMIVQHRKDSAENSNVHWSSYRDCPFVAKSAVGAYKSITGEGWYHGMYKLMVSIAGNAVKQKYPITPTEIAVLCKEIDMETGGWYENRPLETEAERAIEFMYKNG